MIKSNIEETNKNIHIQVNRKAHAEMKDVKEVAGSILNGDSTSFSWRDVLLYGTEYLEEQVEKQTGKSIEDLLEKKDELAMLENIEEEPEDVDELLKDILSE